MRKVLVAVFTVAMLAVLAAGCLFGAAGCAGDPDPVLYSVSYDAGGGTGTAPAVQEYEEGEAVTLAQNPFAREGFSFAGWEYGETVYQASGVFTMPAEDVVFIAQWDREEPGTPAFSQTEYAYDRLGGGDLELPLDLAGFSVYYVELNDARIPANVWSYDDETGCLVILEAYMLTLEDGSYTVKAITDAADAAAPQCTVSVDNSVKTSFDEVTTKNFRYGMDGGVSFNVDFNGVQVAALRQDGVTVDPQYYELKDDVFTVKAEWLRHYYDRAEYELELTNHDSYTFTILTNVIFYTDYDLTTIHDTTVSNVGVNPLYQYYDNVQITEAPANGGLEGKVLKFTPNTQDVLYDCHGIYTLKADKWDSLWYAPGITDGKVYAISFDYVTEGTSAGEFRYQSVSSGYSEDLILGQDGVKHHFEVFLTSEQIGNGVYLWAFFKGGGGSVYFDNFTMTEIDALPEFTPEAPYEEGDYTVPFDPNGMIFSFSYNGTPIEGVIYDESAGTVTFPESFMQTLSAGTNTIGIVTPVGTMEVEVRVVEPSQAELADTVAEYRTGATGDVRLMGSFSEGVTLDSLKMKPKSYNGGYDGWEFVYDDTELDFADRVTLVSGLDGTGYLLLPEEFMESFWGESVFVAEFSNGKQAQFTLQTDSVMLANADESRLHGLWSGVRDFNTPLNSGWAGAAGDFSARDGGGNAFYIRSTAQAGGHSCYAYTVKFHDHDWDWYLVPSSAGNLYRITFEYQFKNLPAGAQPYFMMMVPSTEDLESDFYGTGYTKTLIDDYYELRWNLNTDGEVHTFDSGWFTWSDQLRLSAIYLTDFAAEEGRYVMLDNYRVVESAGFAVPAYTKDSGSDYTFGLNGYGFGSLTIDGSPVEATFADGQVTVKAADMAAYDYGAHTLEVVTDKGVALRAVLSVGDGTAAVLTETEKSYSYGDTSVKLAGTFGDGVTVVSATKRGSHWFDRSFAAADTLTGDLSELFEVSADGLTVKKALLDILYGRTEITVTLSNHVRLRFVLTNNVVWYSDWDDTYVQQPAHQDLNHYTSQDSSALSVAEYGGGHGLRYYPFGATGLAKTAPDNFFQLFLPAWAPSNIYMRLPSMTVDKDYIVTFDYTVTGEDPEVSYYFGGYNSTGMVNLQTLDAGSNTFSYTISGGQDLNLFGIACTKVGGSENCWLTIDNYRIVAVEKEG